MSTPEAHVLEAHMQSICQHIHLDNNGYCKSCKLHVEPSWADDEPVKIKSDWDELMEVDIIDETGEFTDYIPAEPNELSEFIDSLPSDTNNGGHTNYYDLPTSATSIQDLIEHQDMSWNIANIFKACYRLGKQDHSDSIRDLNKIRYFIDRQIALEQL